MQNTLPTPPTLRVLRVDASARVEGSITRQLADLMISGLQERVADVTVTRRDVAQGLPYVDTAWVNANFIDPASRSEAHRESLSGSDALVAEVMNADVWVIGVPIYNFGVPASLKAWIDQIARARLTFHYTDQGPQGLLTGKKVYILTATGGTEVGSEIDFATPWLKFVLGFLGITDVEVIAADRGMMRGDAARAHATLRIDHLLARDWPALAAA
ncbi:MAG: FMN-dependent NADH-azoreductase [Sulfuriferula multivorans]|uniref:FMN dependent NADH:quinone oxidoreductase n=1 Tax=Sulfuriferula multivorans TaxID=1559896 RepID=A0A7C9P9B4_9PROT|nr:FMN-dependent NADH-azoreductase [Sulfuriferula multivorans]